MAQPAHSKESFRKRVALGRRLRRVFGGGEQTRPGLGGSRPEQFKPNGVKTVLLVFDEDHAGTRYRSGHHAEQLDFLGVSNDLVQSDRIDLAAAIDHYACFILNRVEWSDEVAAFVDRARSRDIPVIFETDDLIFEPDLSRYFAFLQGWSEQEQQPEIEKLDRFRKTLQECDGAIVSTEPLADYAGRRTQQVGVVFNSVSEEMVRLADEALDGADTSSSGNDEVTIAYLSGTRTHNRDFLEAAEAVLWGLDAYPETRLLVVGKLDLDERFARYGRRVDRIPLQPWQALPKLLTGVDINLAPLEPDNPVTECKSCVKYLEAGLLAVPTVASPNPDFVRASQGGRTCLLASSPTKWRGALQRLIESESLRRELGELARADVLQNHTMKVRAGNLREALTAFGVSV